MSVSNSKKNNKNQRQADILYQEENDSQDFTKAASETQTDFSLSTDVLQAQPSALILLAGPKSLIGYSWSLVQDSTILGRSNKYSDIFISDDKISKTHFQILNKKGDFYIMDLNSTNRTFKNREGLQPHKEYRLKDNDIIKAGYLIFKFVASGNADSFAFREMFKKAQTDSLTGTYNRQSLEFKGQEFFSEILNFSIIVFDVDKFKTINDSYGHLAGDYILKTIAQLVQELIRQEDLFFRYGGDEFCILTSFGLQVTETISKRIFEKIKNYQFCFEKQAIPTEVSIGFASKEEGDKSWQDIYKRADKKCYEVKAEKK